MRAIIAAVAILACTATAQAQYDTTGRLKWTWDGSFAPPVRSTVDQEYPSQIQANTAFRALRDGNPEQTIDWRSMPGARAAYGVFLFACKRGAYDATRHIVQNDSGWVHCMTHFVTSNGKTLYKQPVNFIQQSRESWDIVLPTTERVLQSVVAPKRKYLFEPSNR